VLVGPSGCGKSTLLRMIAGLEIISGGEIEIGGRVGGQRQRVAMGRAIVRDPQVFLFDEPLSNLDAKLRVAMRAEIRALHQRLSVTTVYVTHDQIEAMTMADKIVVVNEGRIEQIGGPLQLYDHPANLFVAEFIGSPAMNLIEGRIDGNVASTFVADAGINLPLGQAISAASGQPLVYGIRPEHFRLADDGLPAEIVVLEPTGSETLVALSAQGQELVAVFRERLSARPGDHIHIKPDVQLAHVFDAKSGVRLTQ